MAEITIHIPHLRTVSEANTREHWGTKNKRKRDQCREVYFHWKKAAFGKRVLAPPYNVTLIRFGPKTLDDDNLAGSFKGIRDEVSKLLNIDDGDPNITFRYHQEADSDYAVTIQVKENHS